MHIFDNLLVITVIIGQKMILCDDNASVYNFDDQPD